MTTVLEAEGIVKHYSNLMVLDHFHLTVKEKEILGILGPNGSGKTTAVYCMLALLDYEEGEIKIFGQDMRPEAYQIKGKIGATFQDIAIFYELTVYENLSYFCSLYIKDKQKQKQMIKEVVELMRLQEYINYYPEKLSNGLLRTLNIACGIVHQPKLIILDEPLGSIDISYMNQILEAIKIKNQQGATIIYSTNSIKEVEKICTRIAILDKGRIIADGSKEELMKMISLGEKIKISVSDLNEEQKKELKLLPNVYGVEYNKETLFLKTKKGKHNLIRILNFFENEGIIFGEISVKLPTLEDVFLEITGRNLKKK